MEDENFEKSILAHFPSLLNLSLLPEDVHNNISDTPDIRLQYLLYRLQIIMSERFIFCPQ